jgi:hypothetical protein
LAGVLALGAGWAVVGQPAAQPQVELSPRLQWSQRLYDAPTRGGVATADPGYARALAGEVLQRQRSGAYHMDDFPVVETKALFVDDIGSLRVAVVAMTLSQTQPTTDPAGVPQPMAPFATVTFAAARGADAATLAERMQSSSIGLDPLTGAAFADNTASTSMAAVVALAPPGCTIAAAAWPELTDWQPSPTGGLLVHDAAQIHPEWWRVTCDGVVREEAPAEQGNWVAPPTPELITRLAKDARGTVNPQVASDALSHLGGYESGLGGEPRLLWGGVVTWPDSNDNSQHTGATVIAAGPLVRNGGWMGVASVRYDHPDTAGSEGAAAFFSTPRDPTVAGVLTAIRLEPEGRRVLLLAPVNAEKVRAVRDGRTLTESTVDNSVAVVDVDDPDKVEYQALDHTGAVIGSARSGLQVGNALVDTWDNP